MASSKKSAAPMTVRVQLTQRELRTLERVSRHYERNLGAMRYVVLMTSSGEMRSRYRFMRQEGHVLQQLARTTLESMQHANEEQRAVALQTAAVVAFWGRLVSTLTSTRSRRKLSAEEVHIREELAEKLQAAASDLWTRNRRQVQDVIQTRRLAEMEWMQSALTGEIANPIEWTR